MEQRQLLTPRMIQSMEILQMPLGQLEERIEQELQQNPTLEVRTGDPDDAAFGADADAVTNPQLEDARLRLELSPDGPGEQDFDRLNRIADYLENEEFSTNGSFNSDREFRPTASYDGEKDGKLEAMANSPARGETIAEHLLRQWCFIDCSDEVGVAGKAIIAYIDVEGYLRTPLETIHEEHRSRPSMAALAEALPLVQKLDPAGVGARDLRECLLLQLDALEDDPEFGDGHDFDLERDLITNHLKNLEMNRYPLISKRTGADIDDIKDAVRRLGRLTPHPGKSIVPDEAPGINPDAIITYDDEKDEYVIQMTRDPAPNLFIRGMYRKMMKDKAQEKSVREFLSTNIRNARWLIESIEQRRSTIERVIRVVVTRQRDFLDHGEEHLKPLPMIEVADQLGIHVATVSRAVSEKYIQTPRGIFPLRRFFSGGTTDSGGQDMSWDAVKAKLRNIIDDEDKDDPLSDDQLVVKLGEQGIDLARRTVAKYRKIMNIPTARQRKAY